MTAFDAEAFDVAVIGAGHAGVEAALAAPSIKVEMSVTAAVKD